VQPPEPSEVIANGSPPSVQVGSAASPEPASEAAIATVTGELLFQSFEPLAVCETASAGAIESWSVSLMRASGLVGVDWGLPAWSVQPSEVTGSWSDSPLVVFDWVSPASPKSLAQLLDRPEVASTALKRLVTGVLNQPPLFGLWLVPRSEIVGLTVSSLTVS